MMNNIRMKFIECRDLAEKRSLLLNGERSRSACKNTVKRGIEKEVSKPRLKNTEKSQKKNLRERDLSKEENRKKFPKSTEKRPRSHKNLPKGSLQSIHMDLSEYESENMNFICSKFGDPNRISSELIIERLPFA